jgi:inosose dehydratase
VAAVTLRFACQTYSWQMSFDRYRGRVAHMAEVAASAGFAGFEPELVMLGDGWDAASLETDLDRAGIRLAALVLAQPWTSPAPTAAEDADAARAIDAAARLGARLVLVPLPGADRADLRRRQEAAMACMTIVAAQAADRGVASTFHPNSPAGSVFRTADDYAVMRELLPATIGYTPDVGHIAKGGMDPLTVVRDWRDRVDHIHIKDLGADGRWAQTGEGIIDIEGVLRFLDETGFDGWVTFEDESPEAEADPDAATRRNGEWIRDWTTNR